MLHWHSGTVSTGSKTTVWDKEITIPPNTPSYFVVMAHYFHSPPVSAEQGSSVPGGLLQAHIRRPQPSTPSISQPLPVNCSTTPSQHVRSSGFLRRGSDGMKLASRLSTGPCSEYWQFQIGFKDSSLRSATGRLAHYSHCVMRYINTRLLLLLLLLPYYFTRPAKQRCCEYAWYRTKHKARWNRNGRRNSPILSA